MRIFLVNQSDNGLIKKETVCPDRLHLSEFKEQYISPLKEGWNVSVWDENRSDGYELKDGDRVEVCGPLLVDPKIARMKRAEIKRQSHVSKRRHAGNRKP
ncbi:RnfH family protein [Turicimonas muris]|uniref:RnfH family protein n=2 Tax=Turicimonas muris TaxID=1796652 RepID=UPI000B775416|nr:RnfH family protein [Turicimonas muris]MBS4768922.1 RnfH family protein [Burkholderiales bacterium]QQQ97129.1 RnfH family protein [Turicimonas muris]